MQAEAADPSSWRVKLLAAEQVFRSQGSAGQDEAAKYLAEAEQLGAGRSDALATPGRWLPARRTC